MPRLIHRRRAPASDAETADAVLRLAVLLQAGVPAARAWAFVIGDAQPAPPTPASIAARGGAWRAVAAAWDVSSAVGAPLADSLRAIASALRDAQETADQVRVTLAEPAGTARLMAWLPLVAVGLGALLGFDTVAVLIGSPGGWVCAIAGILCMVAARRWSAKLVRGAAMPAGVPGLRAELTAIALRGGVSVERAATIVEAALMDADVADARGARPAADDKAAGTAHPEGEILVLSREAGVPAVELLRASATLARLSARTEGRMRAARLASRLLIPLGVCTLPAFLLLGVAPMLLSVLGSTVPSLSIDVPAIGSSP
ncbi:pilus assembly protein TadB [Microbacterium candidum]|uniref:Pilus assembly protein TadB n=1 Tax=Microbacterium candidum TaxID=3041922 RepID=A0ABT7N2X8_9MICO|nr:pilus assembly protein TadB [Microbacterium sp. ASV49]MDL9981026.1 pilus assembly protein TadB [Microbacterium sp. ASV49]